MTLTRPLLGGAGIDGEERRGEAAERANRVLNYARTNYRSSKTGSKTIIQTIFTELDHPSF